MIFLITLWPFNILSDEAPMDMKEFNVDCPAEKLCPELENQYQVCKVKPNSDACLKYIEIFKKLVPIYDCQRPYDHTLEKDYIVPAFWLCAPQKQWDYIELLSELEINEAKEFFASPEFRSILDGELAEGFFEKSVKKESELKAVKH